ncbi:unnamed protein product [Rotaria sp. Silwood1]|nr:unnamed protein product [Rotaria sp. Silwood1]CAF1628671.1 unnamed protein product [Rotaria sp. Silwood1]CAF3753622.1 unnamed protein product [Rotaria sp. Silwood1]CAF3783087.1 unnamed protein product [Rotaria sp. Silwood1]CAF3857293.1 unnamed protein product [Rotaria sp. Silwood1]
MTHRSLSSSIPSSAPGPTHEPARHLSRLTDKPIASSSSSNQNQYLLINNQTKKTHNNTIVPPPPPLTTCNQISSTPRRPLDESKSPEFQLQNRSKKSRPHEPTPKNFNSNNKTTTTPSSSSLAIDRQFCFSSAQLKYAISNKLPCFF